MTELLIGCPVRDRAWIIRRWFEHVHIALLEAGVTRDRVAFAFIGDQAGDATFREIDRACLDLSYSRTVLIQEGDKRPYERVWGWDRYLEMAHLRNRLLRYVRTVEPDLYWSLDSDILVAPGALKSLVNTLDERDFDAVGGCCYMSPTGRTFPSYAQLRGQGGLRREDQRGVFSVDVIMASKLLTPKAYAVDYAAHRQGEDIGWSIAARQAGCRLGWDGTVVSKHVMRLEDLDKLDARCGF